MELGATDFYFFKNGFVEHDDQSSRLNANGHRLMDQLIEFVATYNCLPCRIGIDTCSREIELRIPERIEALLMEHLSSSASIAEVKNRLDFDNDVIDMALDGLRNDGFIKGEGDLYTLTEDGSFALRICTPQPHLYTVRGPLSSVVSDDQDDEDSSEITAATEGASYNRPFCRGHEEISVEMEHLEIVSSSESEIGIQVDETRYRTSRFHREHRLLEALSQFGGQQESQADYLAEQIWYSSNLAVPHFSPEHLSYNSVDRFSGPNFVRSPYSLTPFQNEERAAFRRRFRKTRRRDYLAALQGFIEIVYHKIRELLRPYPNLRQEFIDGNGGLLFPRNIPGYDIPFGPGSKKNQLMKSAMSAYRSFRRYSELVETVKTRQ